MIHEMGYLQCVFSMSESLYSYCLHSLYSHYLYTGMCGGGLTSSDGRPPCTACPKGTYYFNSTYCESCPTGRTTRYVGASSISDCRLESFLRGMYARSLAPDKTGYEENDFLISPRKHVVGTH